MCVQNDINAIKHQLWKNKTNHPISSNIHPSATANIAIHLLKRGGNFCQFELNNSHPSATANIAIHFLKRGGNICLFELNNIRNHPFTIIMSSEIFM